MSFVHHCRVYRYVVRLEILLYVKSMKSNQSSWNCRVVTVFFVLFYYVFIYLLFICFIMFYYVFIMLHFVCFIMLHFCFIALFILSVIAISIPCLDYLWEISKWLKQHLFVHNFTNPEDNCHMFDNHSCTTDT